MFHVLASLRIKDTMEKTRTYSALSSFIIRCECVLVVYVELGRLSFLVGSSIIIGYKDDTMETGDYAVPLYVQ